MNKATYFVFITAVLLLASACSQKPAELRYGQDECAYCRMMITDARYAGQVVTTTGKAIKFDSIECMASYTGEHKQELQEAKLWVSNFNKPGEWLEIEKATIVRSDKFNSPMGASLLAFGSDAEALRHLDQYQGTVISWAVLVK